MMREKTFTIRELLEHPEVRELTSHEETEKISAELNKPEQIKDPVYIRILSGVGAWFAALFFVLFLSASFLIKSEAGAVICGILFLVCAVALTRTSKDTVFVSQLSLALAFAGNVLVLFGFSASLRYGYENYLAMLVMIQAAVCGIVYPIYRNSIYRFLSPIALAILVTAWILEHRMFYFIHLLIAAEMLLLGILALSRKPYPALAPLMYSAAAMLPATLLFMNFTQINAWRADFDISLLPSSLLLAVGTSYLFVHLAGGMFQRNRVSLRNSVSVGLNRLTEPWLIFVIASTILLGIFTTPGILVAVGLLVLGYAFGDYILTGLSYLFLPVFLVLFYYTMNIDLAYKSYMVGGSGLLLLAVRYFFAAYFATDKNKLWAVMKKK